MPSLRETLAGRAAPGLMPYLTLGDPAGQQFVEWALELVDGGCAALELGVPAAHAYDSESILRGHRRALAVLDSNGALELLAKVAQRVRCPIVAVTHFNEAVDDEAQCRALAQAGAAATLNVGLTTTRAKAWADACKHAGLETVLSVTAQMPPRAREWVYRLATGAVYLARSRAGGADASAELCQAVVAETPLPVIVGFGVRDRATVAALGKAGARGVAIGSLLAELVERRLEHKLPAQFRFADTLREMAVS